MFTLHERVSLAEAHALVPGLPFQKLAEAFAGLAWCAVWVDSSRGDLYFTCPACRHHDHNGGTALVVDEIVWRCHRCKVRGTRFMVERLVMEDADALERLAEILTAEAA